MGGARASRRLPVRLALALSITAVALWLTFRGKNPAAVWAAVRRADYRYLVPYAALLVGSHLVRTLRWGLLLRPVAFVPFAELNAVCAVGFMASLVMPLRTGELARPLLIADGARVRASAALSTVVLERVADAVVSAQLLALALLLVPSDAPGVALLRAGGVAALIAFSCCLALLVVAAVNGPRAGHIAHRLLDPVSPRLAAAAAGAAAGFVEGLRALPTRAGPAAFLALSAANLALACWSTQVLARAFGLELGVVPACTVVGAVLVGTIIPAAPGFAGTFQAAVILALSVFLPSAVVATDGVAFANVLWIAQVAQAVVTGLAFLPSRHVHVHRLLALKAP